MLVSSTLALGLSFGLSTTLASPILTSRQETIADDDNSTATLPGGTVDTGSVLKPETVALIDAAATGFGINGAIVAYTSPKGDGVVTFGNRTVEGEPVTSDTHFALASNSKLFLGTILAWLAEKNATLPDGTVYSLDTPLKDIVPDFKMFDANATEQATSLDLLSHRAGLPPHNFAINPSDTSKTWMERLQYLKPIHPFRSQFEYSNVNFAAMGYVVELITGKSYYEVLDEWIFQPLEMQASSDYVALRDSGAEISQGYIRQGVNYTACGADIAAMTASINGSESDAALASLTLPESCAGTSEAFEFWTNGSGQEWGAGGNVIATGTDLTKWLKELVNPQHFPLSVIERVETPPYPGETGEGYALGTVVQDYRGYISATHDGALPGSNSLTTRVRNESVGVFALSTDDNYAMSWYQLVLPAVLDDLLGLPPVNASAEGEGGEGGTSDTASDPLAALPAKLPPPADARSPPAADTLVGQTFEAPGYAPFTISTVNMSDIAATEAAGIPIDFFRSEVATLAGINYAGEVMYTNWGQTVAKMMFFSHYDGPIYNVTGVFTRDKIQSTVEDGESAFLGKWFGGPSAVVTETGIGFFDGFWGGQGNEANIQVVETDVDQAAEVFFARQ